MYLTGLILSCSLSIVASFAPLGKENRVGITKSSTPTTVHSATLSQPSNGYYKFDMSDLPVSVGDADSAFRHGNNLESQGLFRTAHAAYHEAATLYQCFLDQDIRTHEFSHVTELKNESNENSCRRYLAETCMRLAFLSMDALGDPKAAIRLYKEATTIDPNTNVWAYDGIGTAIEASFPGNLRDAVRAYRQALNLEDNDLTRFHLGVALERLGEESEEIMDSIRRSEANYACLVDSWGYIRYAK